MYQQITKSVFLCLVGLLVAVGCGKSDKKLDGVWQVSHVTAKATTAVDTKTSLTHIKFENGKLISRENDQWDEGYSFKVDGDNLVVTPSQSKDVVCSIENYTESKFILNMPVDQGSISLTLERLSADAVGALENTSKGPAPAAVDVRGYWEVTRSTGTNVLGYNPDNNVWLIRFEGLLPRLGEMDEFNSYHADQDWDGHNSYTISGTKVTVSNGDELNVVRTGNKIIINGTTKDGRTIQLEATLIDKATAEQLINEYKS